MKITLLEGEGKFLFDWEGQEQEVTFQSILESQSWINNKIICIEHEAVDERGNHSITVLNRDVFTETMKEGDEAYHKHRGYWDLNTTIHRLYCLLDGKTMEEAEAEVNNISEQRTRLDRQYLDWNDDKIVRHVAALEAGKLEEAQTILAEQQPTTTLQEMKKMYFAARDTSKPDIKLSNVTPNVVMSEYGHRLVIR